MIINCRDSNMASFMVNLTYYLKYINTILDASFNGRIDQKSYDINKN